MCPWPQPPADMQAGGSEINGVLGYTVSLMPARTNCDPTSVSFGTHLPLFFFQSYSSDQAVSLQPFCHENDLTLSLPNGALRHHKVDRGYAHHVLLAFSYGWQVAIVTGIKQASWVQGLIPSLKGSGFSAVNVRLRIKTDKSEIKCELPCLLPNF